MKHVIAIVLLVSFTQNSLAADSCGGVLCSAVQIKRLYVTASGALYVGTSGDEKLLNCKASANVYLTLPADSKGFDAIYASLLAYQLAGNPVNIRVVEGSDGCDISYVTFDK